MYRTTTSVRSSLLGLVYGAMVFGILASVEAAEDDGGAVQLRDKSEQHSSSQVSNATIDFYDAIQQGRIEVKVVPSDYSSLTMRVRNVTRSPLKVTLPATFAAVPVARMQARHIMQMRGVNASLGNTFGQGIGNSQGLGGSLGGPWWGSMAERGDVQDAEKPAADGPQVLALAPGRFAQTQIPCFCLEFGKSDPNSHIPYAICPLEALNNNPAVSELLVQFAQQGTNQYVAQLAAWHIANKTPWQLLAKVQFPRTKNSRGHRVTPIELAAAKRLAETIPSYGGQGSLSGRR